jgi:hypothetical protein
MRSPRSMPCPRRFEAQALRDGRLAGSERTSFERHASACPGCGREVQALEALAQALRAGLPDSGRAVVDELHAQRERARLLAAFEDVNVASQRSARPSWSGRARRRLVWPVGLVALAAGCFVLWRVRPGTVPVRAVASAVVHGDDSATWSVRTEGNREEVTLQRGSLWIHVDHRSQAGSPPGNHRLLVVLPDGELEDTGTIFSVSAEHGRTTHVAVAEGSVVLRIRGQRPITIGAGGTWPPQIEPSAPARPNVAPASAAAAPHRPPAPRPTPPRPRATRSLAAAVADPAVDFRAAWASFAAGENRAAAGAFTTFLVRHPRDPRAEDAAYLRIIALQRCEATGEMKAAAQDYLRRFPAGFRRAEVEVLSGGPP